jgi:Kef-type K+ transport system membrane component KefB
MKSSLPVPLVVTFCVCFLVGVFGGFLAPQPFNFVSVVLGIVSLALFIPIGRRIGGQKDRPRDSRTHWRITVGASVVALVILGCLGIGIVCMFVRNSRVDFGLALEWCLSLVVILGLGSRAIKRLRASENEEKG